MLRVDIRRLGSGGLETNGSIPGDDPLFEGLSFEIDGAVEVVGKLQATDGEDYLWRGQISASVVGECRRCLGRVVQQIDQAVDVIFSGEAELADDPSVYPLPHDSAVVDVSVAVREELALCTSGFPLCRAECKGLCSGCGADLNAGLCNCAEVGMTN